jgi:hypothetical protein
MSTPTTAIPAGQPVPEPGVEPDGIDTPTLLMWGFISVVIVLGVIFAASALYFAAQRQLNAERVYAPPYEDSDKVVTDQMGVLASYAPPAGAGLPYAIPIDRAKQLVLAELQSKKSE